MPELLLESLNTPPYEFTREEKYGGTDILYKFEDDKNHAFRMRFRRHNEFGRNVFLGLLSQKTPGFGTYRRIVQKFNNPMKTIATVVAILRKFREDRPDARGVVLQIPDETFGTYLRLIDKIVARELKTEYSVPNITLTPEDYLKMGVVGHVLVSKPYQYESVYTGEAFKELLQTDGAATENGVSTKAPEPPATPADDKKTPFAFSKDLATKAGITDEEFQTKMLHWGFSSNKIQKRGTKLSVGNPEVFKFRTDVANKTVTLLITGDVDLTRKPFKTVADTFEVNGSGKRFPSKLTWGDLLNNLQFMSAIKEIEGMSVKEQEITTKKVEPQNPTKKQVDVPEPSPIEQSFENAGWHRYKSPKPIFYTQNKAGTYWANLEDNELRFDILYNQNGELAYTLDFPFQYLERIRKTTKFKFKPDTEIAFKLYSIVQGFAEHSNEYLAKQLNNEYGLKLQTAKLSAEEYKNPKDIFSIKFSGNGANQEIPTHMVVKYHIEPSSYVKFTDWLEQQTENLFTTNKTKTVVSLMLPIGSNYTLSNLEKSIFDSELIKGVIGSPAPTSKPTSHATNTVDTILKAGDNWVEIIPGVEFLKPGNYLRGTKLKEVRRKLSANNILFDDVNAGELKVDFSQSGTKYTFFISDKEVYFSSEGKKIGSERFVSWRQSKKSPSGKAKEIEEIMRNFYIQKRKVSDFTHIIESWSGLTIVVNEITDNRIDALRVLELDLSKKENLTKVLDALTSEENTNGKVYFTGDSKLQSEFDKPFEQYWAEVEKYFLIGAFFEDGFNGEFTETTNSLDPDEARAIYLNPEIIKKALLFRAKMPVGFTPFGKSVDRLIRGLNSLSIRTSYFSDTLKDTTATYRKNVPLDEILGYVRNSDETFKDIPTPPSYKPSIYVPFRQFERLADSYSKDEAIELIKDFILLKPEIQDEPILVSDPDNGGRLTGNSAYRSDPIGSVIQDLVNKVFQKISDPDEKIAFNDSIPEIFQDIFLSKNTTIQRVAFISSWTFNGGSFAQNIAHHQTIGIGPNEDNKNFYNASSSAGSTPATNFILKAARSAPMLKEMYSKTQEFLAKKFKKEYNGGNGTILLYRGVAVGLPPNYVAGAIESWTTDPKTAINFANMMTRQGTSGIVLVASIPYSAIIGTYQSLNDVFPMEKFLKGKKEWMVLGGTFKETKIRWATVGEFDKYGESRLNESEEPETSGEVKVITPQDPLFDELLKSGALGLGNDPVECEIRSTPDTEGFEDEYITESYSKADTYWNLVLDGLNFDDQDEEYDTTKIIRQLDSVKFIFDPKDDTVRLEVPPETFELAKVYVLSNELSVNVSETNTIVFTQVSKPQNRMEVNKFLANINTILYSTKLVENIVAPELFDAIFKQFKLHENRDSFYGGNIYHVEMNESVVTVSAKGSLNPIIKTIEKQTGKAVTLNEDGSLSFLKG